MSLDINKSVENTPSAAAGQTQSSAPLCEHHGHRQHPLFVSCDETHTVIDLGSAHRIALMVTPDASDELNDQIWDAVAAIRAVLKQQPVPMTLTFQSVFLRRAEDAVACRQLLEAYFGDKLPVTNYYVQPPCGGQALAIEAWGVGGAGVEVEFPSRDVAKISYDGLRWFYTGGVHPAEDQETAFDQGRETFQELAARLQASDFRFNDVVRIWLYMGGITAMDAASGLERYRELNRARTEFFDEQEQAGLLQIRREGRSFFPASTGIGMGGQGLEVSCMALQTDRNDVQLLPLENPNQTSAFEYAQTYSPKSPKFSRAMAEIVGNSVITWVSGTASIIDSKTVHLGDATKQTEQTIDNIENLISKENFARHSVSDAGARLSDFAKIRVYVKHPEDYEACRAVCERRFGHIPAIYAIADVCRPDLLVEIEGVAFSRISQQE